MLAVNQICQPVYSTDSFSKCPSQLSALPLHADTADADGAAANMGSLSWFCLYIAPPSSTDLVATNV